MGTFRRVLLGAADLVDRSVRDGKIDLVGGRAGLFGPEPEAAEQRFGHAVMPLIFLERTTPPIGKPALSAEP